MISSSSSVYLIISEYIITRFTGVYIREHFNKNHANIGGQSSISELIKQVNGSISLFLFLTDYMILGLPRNIPI